MDESVPLKTVSFKDLIDKKDVSITGRGTFFIGLSSKGDVVIATTDDDLCMPLMTLTLHETGGCTLSPANTDLPCYIDGSDQPLLGETHLIDGAKLEVADKKLVFIDGPIPKRRRKLPPTPGTSVGDPPAKPTRNSDGAKTEAANTTSISESKQSTDETISETDGTDDVTDSDKRWLETSWCMLDLDDKAQNMFHELQTPEQISILAASYFAKQVRMFTDASVTPKLLDDIFKLFTDTIDYCKEVYMSYLSDISRALVKVPDKSHSRPMHGPAVRFLTELLKQGIEPVEKVVLILDLLRTFSHFDNNLGTMVRYQTTPAVLGSISAYLDVVEVQRYGIDILAKIATYKPSLDKKAPLREVGLDMVIRSVKYHNTDLLLSRSTCRVLANISTTLITLLNTWFDTESASDSHVVSTVEQYEQLLAYVFKAGIPVIQSIMKSFGSDLGVNTEGRKFIFYYAKHQQLQIKKASWLKAKSDENEIVGTEHDEEKQEETGETRDGERESHTTCDQLLAVERREEEPQGILKKVGSYENLKTAERRLVFADDTFGGSDSDITYSSASENELGESFSGDVAVPVDEDFSNHIVQHLVRKTIKKRKQSCTNTEAEAVASDSESENEFLQSLTVKPELVETNSSSAHAVNKIISAASPNESGEIGEVNKDSEFTLKKENSQKEDREKTETEIGDVEDTEKNESYKTQDIIDGLNETDTSKGNNEMELIKTEISNDVSKQGNSRTHDKACSLSDIKQSAIIDVTFLGKLVRTQIVVYVGSLVFKEEDSMVLMVIDKPIRNLLEDAAAPPGLLEFAGSQYGANMTLMDLEPAIVISIIDAVRYRSVTKDLVQSAVLSLTRTINEKLLAATLNTTMLFFKALFSDVHLQAILTEEEFVKEFRTCFQNATERMEKSHCVEDLRKNLASLSVVI